MLPSKFLQACFALLVFSLGTTLTAQESKVDQRVDELIEQLDSAKFSERVAATRQLQRMGASAIKPLESVVINGNTEAANRALELLKRNYKSGVPSLSKPSADALRRIANNHQHPMSRAAESVLEPAQPIQSPNAPRLAPAPLRPAPLRRPPVVQQGRVSVSVRIINGQRDVSIKENGTQWRFRDTANGGVQVERPDGNGGVKKATYKDEKAFEQADAEAFKKFKQYTKGNGNRINLQFNGGMFPAIPGMQGPRMQLPNLQVPQIQIPQRLNPGQLNPGDGQLRPLRPRQRIEKPKPKLPAGGDLIEV